MSGTSMSVTAKVTSKGQITIPAEIRERLQLNEGDTVLFQVPEDQGGKASIRKVPAWRDLAGSVVVPEEWKDATWQEIREYAHRAVAARYLREHS